MVRLPDSAGEVKKTLIDRRDYLKAAGATAIGGLALGTIGEGAAASYRTVTVPVGGRKLFSLGSGDTLENVLIDVTAKNADAHINASGDGWTIRNVAFKGKMDLGHQTGGYSNLMEVQGNGLVENVYMGDGVTWGIRKGAIGSPASHAGHIDFKRVYFAEFSGNGVYAAGSGRVNPPGSTDGGGGTYTFDTCYARDNNIAHFRLASDGTKLVNTTITNTNRVPPAPLTAAGQSGVVNSRGLYTGYGDPSQHIQIRNCNIDITAANTEKYASKYTSVAESALVSGVHSTYGDLTNVDVYNSQIRGRVIGNHVNLISGNGSNPDVSVQPGVPTTPEAAASGSSATSGGSTTTTPPGSTSGSTGTTTTPTSLPNTISISGGSASNVVHYSFTVSNTLQKSTAGGASIDAGDKINGTTATGAIAGGIDSYDYAGDITAFTVDSGATVTVNGKQVDPATLGQSSSGSTTTTSGSGGSSSGGSGSGGSGSGGSSSGGSGSGASSSTLSISGGSASNVLHYAFKAGTSVEKSTAGGASIDPGDIVSGTMVTGAIAGGTDSYTVVGGFTAFSVDGAATVTLDGKQVDPATLGTPLPNTITVSGGSASNPVDYTVTVSKSILKSRANGATINASDGVSGGTATGTVSGGADSYVFAGDITSFSLDGNAKITVNGQTTPL